MTKYTNYAPSAWYSVLLVGFTLVLAWRISHIFWIASISGHLTNFALTGLAVLLIIGPRAFKQWDRRNRVIVATVAFFVANILAEIFLGTPGIPLPGGGALLVNFNTVDLLDALFGIFAIAIIWGTYFAQNQRQINNSE